MHSTQNYEHEHQHHHQHISTVLTSRYTTEGWFCLSMMLLDEVVKRFQTILF